MFVVDTYLWFSWLTTSKVFVFVLQMPPHRGLCFLICTIMPLPKRNSYETRDEFIDRCMSDSVMNKEYPDNKQRLAVCSVQWRKK